MSGLADGMWVAMQTRNGLLWGILRTPAEARLNVPFMNCSAGLEPPRVCGKLPLWGQAPCRRSRSFPLEGRALRSHRAQRDALLMLQVHRVWLANIDLFPD